MARAKQLPSGSWRVQVYAGTENGKRKYISITAATEKEANYAALQYQLGVDQKAKVGKTVGEAIDDYIAMKDGVLAPSTISGYKKIRKNTMQGIMDKPIKILTQEDVQREFNTMAKTPSKRTGEKPSPKYLANAHGLLYSALDVYGIELKTRLPAKQKIQKDILTAEEVIAAIRGTDMELPCLLSMWLSFSMSEIRGICVEDIKNDVITLRQTVVDVDGVPTVRKGTKAYERARRIAVPSYIMDLIKQTDAYKAGSGPIVNMTSSTLYERWSRILEKNNLPHMRFHDLRHLSASIGLALNIPDKYMMERGGWETNSVMKGIYQHTFSNERIQVDRKIDDYFFKLLDP